MVTTRLSILHEHRDVYALAGSSATVELRFAPQVLTRSAVCFIEPKNVGDLGCHMRDMTCVPRIVRANVMNVKVHETIVRVVSCARSFSSALSSAFRAARLSLASLAKEIPSMPHSQKSSDECEST